MVGEKYVWTSRLIQTIWILSCTVTETVYTSKSMNGIWSSLNTVHFWQNEFISWATLTSSTSGALCRMKQLFMIKTISAKIGWYFPHEHFPIVPGTIVFAKIYFYLHVFVGILDFPYLRWNKNLSLVQTLDMVTRTWRFFSSFQSTYTTRKNTRCCWSSAGT